MAKVAAKKTPESVAATPPERPAVLPSVIVPPPPVARPTAPAHSPVALVYRLALEAIVKGRLCGCSGMHESHNNDCPKTIARRALE